MYCLRPKSGITGYREIRSYEVNNPKYVHFTCAELNTYLSRLELGEVHPSSIIDNQRNYLETQAKASTAIVSDATSVIRPNAFYFRTL